MTAEDIAREAQIKRLSRQAAHAFHLKDRDEVRRLHRLMADQIAQRSPERVIELERALGMHQ